MASLSYVNVAHRSMLLIDYSDEISKIRLKEETKFKGKFESKTNKNLTEISITKRKH